LTVDRSVTDEERLLEVALEAGAEDVKESDDVFEVTTEPESFDAVKEALDAAGIPTLSAEVGMVPQGTVSLTGVDAEKTLKMMEELEDHDDIQSVSSNFDIPQEELERLSAA
jgi:transcriptional/translational regulatory protein YebC/TACO1